MQVHSRRLLRLSIAAAALTASAATPVHAQARASAATAVRSTDLVALRKEIEALSRAMVAAFKESPAKAASFYTDDARIIGGGARYEGRQQVDAYWAQATGFKDWSLEVLDVGGDMATPWLLGRSTLTSESGRAMVVEYLGVLRRMPDGSLKYQVDFFKSASAPVVRTP